MRKYVGDQRGMTAIMFALIFGAILTMLAIGFSFLVRNDQRQTLDRNLSFQARYAAESGINKTVDKIRSDQNDGTKPETKTTCDQYDLEEGLKITCVKWDTSIDYIQKDSLGSEPYVVSLKPEAATTFKKLSVVWRSETASSDHYDSLFNDPSDPLPDIDNTKPPVIRVAIMKKTATGYDDFKQFYIVPAGSQINNSISSTLDGGLMGAACVDKVCTIDIDDFDLGYGTGDGSIISVAAIGLLADSIKFSVYDGSGDLVRLEEAQIIIDSNAMAEDVTQRVEARIPYYPDETWNPGFAVAAKEICKDIKIDGTNNDTAVSNPADSACPNTTP